VGFGAYSNFLTVAMPRTPVVAPVISLTSKNMVSIVVAWTAITSNADLGNNPLLYYQLEWSTSSTFATITNYLTGSGHTTTSFTLNRSTYPYSAATNYYFRVAVYN
jgi:phosphodiesterase/alkaline phosphatase D-like protein